MGDLIIIIFTIVGMAIGWFIYEFFDTSGLELLLGAIYLVLYFRLISLFCHGMWKKKL